MESRLTIKNFRIFDEKGATFEFNPITILTGANNSGKSSVVKAVSLLNGFLFQIQNDIETGMLKQFMSSTSLDKYRLDFTTYPNNLLGGFDRIINDGSDSREVTFEYTIDSQMISEEVTVKLTFVSDIEDEINYGFIKSLEISSSEGVIFSSSSGKSKSNLNLIIDEFIDFAEIEHLISESIDLIDNCSSDEEIDAIDSQVNEKLKCFSDKRVADVVNYLRFKNNAKIYIENEEDFALFNRMKENGSLFQFSLIDEISDLDKQEVPVFIDGLLAETKWSEERLQAIHRVMNDFMESDFQHFCDYFNAYESGYLFSILDDSQTSSVSFDLSLLVHRFSLEDDANSEKDKICALFPDYANELKANLDPLGLWSSLSLRENVKKRLMEEDDNIIRNELVHPRGMLHDIRKEIREQSPVHFAMIYHVIKWLEELYILNIRNVEKMPTLSKITGDLVHIFAAFADDFVRECFCTDLSGRLFYIEPTFANVKRLYPLDGIDNFTSLLRKYLESKRKFDFINLADIGIDIDMYEEPNDFMNYWIKEFGIGRYISLNQDEDKLGVQIRIHDTQGDKGRLLADTGCGTTQLVSILLQIETAILSIKSLQESGKSCYELRCLNRFSEQKNNIEPITIIVEEPEVHLHPAFQSKLTDMFIEAYEKFNIHFIIETHSEYLIRKTQVYVNQMKCRSKSQLEKKNPFAVYYVPTGGKPYKMEYRKDGKFSNEFGPGFFDEASNLLFDIL